MTAAETYKATLKRRIIEAVKDDEHQYLDLVCDLVEMADNAKSELRKKGYGWTGLDLYKTCELVPDNPLE